MHPRKLNVYIQDIRHSVKGPIQNHSINHAHLLPFLSSSIAKRPEDFTSLLSNRSLVLVTLHSELRLILTMVC